MASLINGMAFVLQNAKDPSYILRNKIKVNTNEQSFPKLLVSIGSGVSIIKVDDYNKFERVSGTMIGGGTLLGLSNLLTGINDFDTIVNMAQQGDNSKVDMLVKDIYGESSPFKELQGDLLASSFAKIAFN